MCLHSASATVLNNPRIYVVYWQWPATETVEKPALEDFYAGSRALDGRIYSSSTSLDRRALVHHLDEQHSCNDVVGHY